jgi:hypothetical protein
MNARVDPTRCPLCGEGNACGAAAGEPACWCYGVKISAGALNRVPKEAVGVACVCRRCAEAGELAPPKRSAGA